MNVSVPDSLREIDVATGSMGRQRTFDRGEFEIASGSVDDRFTLEIGYIDIAAGCFQVDVKARGDGNRVVHLQAIEGLIPAEPLLGIWGVDFHFIIFRV